MSTAAVIRAVGLTKVFRDFWQRARVKAVNDVDLEVHEGEIYGLLGPNGSGKSTTIKMLLGLLYASRGTISVFGKPADDVGIKSRIGYLPEESYLYRFLNARETLNYYGTLFQIDRRTRVKRIDELLEMVGLRAAARRPVGEYSKGMQRRIGLAQALINDPDLLILDEPTSGLDPVGSKLVKDIIVRLGTTYKKTILLSSHLLADVEEVCGRVTILYGGKIRVSGTMDEVLSRRELQQITVERLSPETIRAVEDLIKQREGKAITISTPRDRLESLFVRIVEQAHEMQVETHGSAKGGDIAAFLGADASAKATLDALTRVEPAGTPEDETRTSPSSAGQPDQRALSALSGSADAAPDSGREQAAAPPPPAKDQPIDRSLLESLTGDDKKKK